MERISVTEAGRQFDELIGRVSREGVTVELERDNRVVARLSPAGHRVQVADLNRVFASFPSLGDDADSFAQDLDRIRREVRQETDPWARSSTQTCSRRAICQAHPPRPNDRRSRFDDRGNRETRRLLCADDQRCGVRAGA